MVWTARAVVVLPVGLKLLCLILGAAGLRHMGQKVIKTLQARPCVYGEAAIIGAAAPLMARLAEANW